MRICSYLLFWREYAETKNLSEKSLSKNDDCHHE
jgi:hypothetical protein